jgi:hypothetical protein
LKKNEGGSKPIIPAFPLRANVSYWDYPDPAGIISRKASRRTMYG